uniref:Uncharacterized protein n=1 Tax=Compsopogon caeruleus TaxID=31354 RepID=A0A7S1TB35_9RHOD|mmetsp:Transcript_14386/g.29449  ORF Transcript_14386/g.29449 Transcript_14386/m.29449 type:complete len:262 (+) Transcript_14386:104-889(+)|eukprot:CAMPEP_0184682308 /NCGR_PEP_ID=MMETSP0312-20130426/6756_1 /TAXON_ID=31354 /ORGANISM="Compsopogon coeruleus, Strain SAG 36.94" /LENGTH=261 /DNA_ID=CAMNT_0027133895 /DNA_START=61 /DNA_END=846 /DNA_ORIENTATION=+
MEGKSTGMKLFVWAAIVVHLCEAAVVGRKLETRYENTYPILSVREGWAVAPDQKALITSGREVSCETRMAGVNPSCYKTCLPVEQLSQNLLAAMSGRNPHKLSPLEIAMFEESLATSFPNVSVIDCLDEVSLNKIFINLASHFPIQGGQLPAPLPGSFSLPAPTSGQATTVQVGHAGNVVLCGVDLASCPRVPSFYAGTVAFPPCAAAICNLTGFSPEQDQVRGVFKNCVATYKMGVLEMVYAWYYPTSKCIGTEYSQIVG